MNTQTLVVKITRHCLKTICAEMKAIKALSVYGYEYKTVIRLFSPVRSFYIVCWPYIIMGKHVQNRLHISHCVVMNTIIREVD